MTISKCLQCSPIPPSSLPIHGAVGGICFLYITVFFQRINHTWLYPFHTKNKLLVQWSPGKFECACLKILLMFPWVDTDQLLVLYTICRPVAQLSRYLLDITQVGNEKTHEFFVVFKSKYETCVTNLSISYWCLDNLCLFLWNIKILMMISCH